jgi:hypothetical protein
MMMMAPLIALCLQSCQLILFTWLYAGLTAKYCHGSVYRSIFPVGSSSLSDLDQVAALATGLLIALWPLVTLDFGRDVMLTLGIGTSPPLAARAGNRTWIRNRATL